MTKAQKAAYDRKYRKKNLERIKANRAAYFQRTYDPVKAAKERKKRMHKHVAYCRQPRYKAWKRVYDRKRRASSFGEFAAAYEALAALMKEVKTQMPDRFERYQQAGRFQWNPINQRRYRRKTHEQLYSNGDQLKGLALGNP